MLLRIAIFHLGNFFLGDPFLKFVFGISDTIYFKKGSPKKKLPKSSAGISSHF